MESSVETLCNLIAKTKLLPPEKLRSVLPLWKRQPGHDKPDASQRFAKWLVSRGELTAYQADRLARGRTDRYFLHNYKLLERLGNGRMAGVFLVLRSLR
jgi:hypothetical protein